MFYLALENQIHLFIIIIFSSYIYLSSLTIKSDSFIKNYSTAFFIPVILCMMSFLSLNTILCESYLFFAEFLLITVIFISLAFEKNKDSNYFIVLLIYAFPFALVILNLRFELMQRSIVFDFALSLYFAIIFTIIIYSILIKKYFRLLLYTAILSICASMLIIRINSIRMVTILSLLFKAAGYIFFSCFFYKATIYKLKKAYTTSSNEFSRINQNVQREVNHRVEEIERSNRKLLQISKTDSLTGVYTKKVILNFIDNLIYKYPEREFSVLIFDIDNFKKINDKHGHIVGDKCIINLMSIARDTLRSNDELGRYGGDEFLIVLPNTNTVKAYLAAERLRKKVETTYDPHYTISVGVASYPADARSTKDIINAADKTLYISKNKGRNRVTHTGQIEH